MNTAESPERFYWNLDDETEATDFIYGRACTSRELLGKLEFFGVSQRDLVHTANMLLSYARLRLKAMSARKAGEAGEASKAMLFETECDGIYAKLPECVRW